jgi:hypothetical protein
MTQRERPGGRTKCDRPAVNKYRDNGAVRAVLYAMASMIALKVPLGRIAFEVLTGSGS